MNVFGKIRILDVPGDAKVAQRYCFINQSFSHAMHTALVFNVDSVPFSVHSSARAWSWFCMCGPRQLTLALHCTRGCNHRL